MILTDNDINKDKKEAEESDFDSFDGLTRSEATNNSNFLIISLTSKLKEKMKKNREKGPTAKLWIQYLLMVDYEILKYTLKALIFLICLL